MKKIINGFLDEPHNNFFAGIAILSALFLCGAVAGCVTATYISGDSGSALLDYVTGNLLQISSSNAGISLLPTALLNAFKYHSIVFILGFTALGFVLIPAAVTLRGFFLSFSVSSLMKLFGFKGLLLAIAAFGVPNFFALPCLFIIASQATSISGIQLKMLIGGRKGMAAPVNFKQYVARFGVCAIILILCALFDAFLSPHLIGLAASIIIK